MTFVSWTREKLVLENGEMLEDYTVAVNHEVIRDGIPALSTDLKVGDVVVVSDENGDGEVTKIEATSVKE